MSADRIAETWDALRDAAKWSEQKKAVRAAMLAVLDAATEYEIDHELLLERVLGHDAWCCNYHRLRAEIERLA